MAKVASISDDDIFRMRLERSAADLWPMLEGLYGSTRAMMASKRLC